MKFNLKTGFVFSSNISKIKKDLENFLSDFEKTSIKNKSVKIKNIKIKDDFLSFNITSDGVFRPHNALLQLKNEISKEFGKKHHLGIREIKIDNYKIDFDLEKKPLKKFTIPFSDLNHG